MPDGESKLFFFHPDTLVADVKRQIVRDLYTSTRLTSSGSSLPAATAGPTVPYPATSREPVRSLARSEAALSVLPYEDYALYVEGSSGAIDERIPFGQCAMVGPQGTTRKCRYIDIYICVCVCVNSSVSGLRDCRARHLWLSCHGIDTSVLR